MDFKDRVALITGGARIGQAVAEELARRGCHVALVYRHSRAKAEESAGKTGSYGVRAHLIRANLKDPGDLEKIVPDIQKAFGRLDILVNMASVYNKVPPRDIEDAATAEDLPGIREWDENMAVDLKSAYWLSLRAAPLMRRNGGGRVVNFSDWLAASGRPRYKEYPTYYVAKAAVKGLTEALALELAPDILVNAVAPGPILPPEEMPPVEAEEAMTHTPLRRWGGAAEVAKAVMFLIETDFVTGETLRVDGGRHLY